MKKLLIIYLLALLPGLSRAQSAQNQVPDAQMQKIYDEVKTPYKYGLIMVPPGDSKKIDCPSVFRKNGTWYMTYLVFDGRGYETWLAKSANLLQWESLGRILSFSDDSTQWDADQKAGFIALQDYNWGGSYELQKYRDRYWMSYLGGQTKGYELGLLSLGMAYSEVEPTSSHQWNTLIKPVLMSTDQDVRWWENLKQFKSTVVWDREKSTGHPFVMFYNAAGDSFKTAPYAERIGMAVSDDMEHWQRFMKNPVLDHHRGITGDPVIQKIGNVWVMFYFGAFWQKDGKDAAFNRFACSYDMVNWTDWKGANLVEPSEPYDNQFAHKSFVVKWNGVVYHFYCAVNKKDQRGIAVATSKDLGKSKISFSEYNEEVHAKQMQEQINYMVFAPPKRDNGGQLLPLQPYGETIKRAMNFFVNMGTWFKGDTNTLLDENGVKRPVYFYYANLAHNGEVFRECVDSYVSYPAFHHALFIETLLAYYVYSDDRLNLQCAKDLADWNIAHSTSLSYPYGGMPYSTFNKGKPGGFVDGVAIMTDKAAVMTLAYLRLFSLSGEKKYFDASYTIAKKLSENQLPEGNWPFRVDPETRAVREQYTSSIIYAVQLFEAIDRAEGKNTFQNSRDRAFGWLMKNPVETMKWCGYYEDIPENAENRTNWDCIDAARYLVVHRNENQEYLGKALKLNAYLTDSIITDGKTFISRNHPYFPAEGVREQKVCFTPMCGHSAHWASLMADLYNATGEEQYRRRAIQTMNYVTYHLQPNGSIELLAFRAFNFPIVNFLLSSDNHVFEKA
jgi:predicted GH43/DUF377 family glycosyl hydrolase